MKLTDAKNLDYEIIYELCLDAIEEPDRERYIAEYGYPEWFDDISDDPGECVEYLGKIHDIMHLPLKELLEPYHLKTVVIQKMLVLPRSTVNNWLQGVSDPPAWVKLLMIRRLDELTD